MRSSVGVGEAINFPRVGGGRWVALEGLVAILGTRQRERSRWVDDETCITGPLRAECQRRRAGGFW